MKNVVLVLSMCLLGRLTAEAYQLNRIEVDIIRSVLQMRALRVKMLEYLHETLAVPIFSFLISENMRHHRRRLAMKLLRRIADNANLLERR